MPSNLRLSYWEKRHDILVQYDESNDSNGKIRLRCYWLEPINLRINHEKKPNFVSAKSIVKLIAIPISEAAAVSGASNPTNLYGVTLRGDTFFTLYSGTNQLEAYKLPTYKSGSAKKVLLTPFSLVVDATIVGAVIGYYSAPD